MKIEERYARVGERGQVVIPKAIRETEGLQPRQLVRVFSEPGQVVIRKVGSAKAPEDVIADVLAKARFSRADWARIHKEREA